MRLNAQQAAAFPTNGGGKNFLSLSNDGDSAIVRFAYVNVDDIPIHLVHEITEDGKFKHVGCLKRDYSEPNSVCPLCNSGALPKKFIYFNVRNEETGAMQIWSRSEAYFSRNMEVIFKDYTEGGTPLCSIPFKIVRNGVKGDTKTSYNFIARPADTMQLDEFPEDIIVEDEGIVKDYTFQELQQYVNTGVFPNSKQGSAPAVAPRGGAQQGYAQQAPVAQPAPVNNSRRTIMNNGGY